MNTIDEQWAAFQVLVMPKDAPPVQRQEMRRAFYAGAEAMMRLQYGATEPDVSENAAVMMLQGWHEECNLFAQQVADGAA